MGLFGWTAYQNCEWKQNNQSELPPPEKKKSLSYRVHVVIEFSCMIFNFIKSRSKPDIGIDMLNIYCLQISLDAPHTMEKDWQTRGSMTTRALTMQIEKYKFRVYFFNKRLFHDKKKSDLCIE